MKKVNYIIIFSITFIVFLVMIFVSYDDYQNVEQIINSKYNTQYKIVEDGILNTIKYSNAVGQIAEIEANKELEDYSSILINNYRNNPDILDWDLERFKKEFNNTDIYIIDDHLKIVKTTFQPDLGFDFNQLPSFRKIVEDRLNGSSFVTDHMDISTNTGLLMKYGYMPTPDHRYLIEFSINMSQAYPVIGDLDIFSAVNNLKSQYKAVNEILIYKYKQGVNEFLKVSKNKPFYQPITDANKQQFIQETVNLNKAQVYTSPGVSAKASYTYKFIPYLTYYEGTYDWWNSYIIEIVYDNGFMIQELDRTKTVFQHSIVLIVLVFLFFSLLITYFFKKTEYIAYHDHLTNLPNRKLFEENIKNKLSLAKKFGLKMAILFLDIDNFKEINDTLGHETGDLLLQSVAGTLKGILRKGDTISRLGGDEFIILLSDVHSSEDAVIAAQKIAGTLELPVKMAQQEIPIRVSIGISVYPDHGGQVEGLIRKADLAMYYAKKGCLNYMVYNNEIENVNGK